MVVTVVLVDMSLEKFVVVTSTLQGTDRLLVDSQLFLTFNTILVPGLRRILNRAT